MLKNNKNITQVTNKITALYKIGDYCGVRRLLSRNNDIINSADSKNLKNISLIKQRLTVDKMSLFAGLFAVSMSLLVAFIFIDFS